MNGDSRSRSTYRVERDRSVVVVIDMQGRLVDQVYRPDRLRAGIHRLLDIADLFAVPVILTEQYPEGLGPTEDSLLSRFESLSTEHRRIRKLSFGCCEEPGFEEAVADLLPGVPATDRQYVIVGIEAHVCVMQTALELLRAGSQVFVCWEGVSGRGEEYRRYALERMAQAGAVMSNHESVGFEWAGDKDHPQFKAFSRLLREGQVV